MANKRQLTGGTDDVNPQYLSGNILLSGANTTTVASLQTPIVRVGSDNSGQATIMEVLKVFVEMPNNNTEGAAATSRSADFSINTSDPGITSVVGLDSPRTIASFQAVVRNAFTAGGTGMLAWQVDPLVWDLTDGAGHGVLVATDNIFIQASTTGFTGAVVFRYKILYRFKKVKLVEYIGIVQSQQ